VTVLPNHIANPGVSGSIAERTALIQSHLPLVRRIASQLASSFPALLEYEDLIAFGNMGLVEAASKWDAGRGVAFAAFASQRIRGAMIDAMRRVDPLGRTSRTRLKEIEAEKSRMSMELGRDPSQQEVADSIGITGDQYRSAQAAGSVRVLSIDALVRTQDGPQWEPEDPYAEDPEEAAIRASQILELRRELQFLPERLKLVLSLRYVEGLKYSEIAEVLGVSASRVSQLEAHALQRLRQKLAA
jgi:RNA polymerase sigma factor FliA